MKNDTFLDELTDNRPAKRPAETVKPKPPSAASWFADLVTGSRAMMPIDRDLATIEGRIVALERMREGAGHETPMASAVWKSAEKDRREHEDRMAKSASKPVREKAKRRAVEGERCPFARLGQLVERALKRRGKRTAESLQAGRRPGRMVALRESCTIGEGICGCRRCVGGNCR